MWDVGQNSWFRTSAPPQQVPGDVTQLKRQETRDREHEGEIVSESRRTLCLSLSVYKALIPYKKILKNICISCDKIK